MSECDIKLDEIYKKIEAEENGFSYSKVDELAANGKLKTMMDEKKIVYLLFDEFMNFVSKLPGDLIYTRRIELLESNFIKIYNNIFNDYLICSYFNAPNAYRLFPAFFQLLATTFQVEPYNKMSYEEIENMFIRYLKINDIMDPNLYKMVSKMPSIERNNSKKYMQYKIDKANGNLILTEENFPIWAEEKVYNIQKNGMINKFKVKNPDEFVDWTALTHGDGTGYDILTRFHVDNIGSKRESLVEAKTGKSNSITMTLNEYKVAKETIKVNNCNYYVQRYKYELNIDQTIKMNTITPTTVKMNKDIGMFINHNDPKIMYFARIGKGKNNEDIIYLDSVTEPLRMENIGRLRIYDKTEIDKLKTLGKII